MTINKYKTLIFFFLLSLCNYSLANTYKFSIVGWSDGGYFSGSFETSFGAEQDLLITTSELLSLDAAYTGTNELNWTLDDVVYFGTPNVDIRLGKEASLGGPYISTPVSFSPYTFVVGVNNTEFSHTQESMSIVDVTTVVPIPSAAWLFGSGLIGLIGIARRKKA